LGKLAFRHARHAQALSEALGLAQSARLVGCSGTDQSAKTRLMVLSGFTRKHLSRAKLAESSSKRIALSSWPKRSALVPWRRARSIRYSGAKDQRRHFKRGQLTRLILDYLRDHPGVDVSVADITPLAVGDRVITSVEHQRVSVIVYQALHKLAKRGTAVQTSAGVKRRSLAAAGRLRAEVDRKIQLRGSPPP
jgi:hypothetical protein